MRSLAELAGYLDARVQGDGERTVEGIETLDRATERHLSFVTEPRRRRQAEASAAGALLVGEELATLDRDLLVTSEPRWALARLLELFYPLPERAAGVHPTAVVEEGAAVDASACVGPYAVIGAGSRIGAGAIVEAHVVVGPDCTVAEEAVLHPGVVLYARTRIGARSVVHAGTVLGSDGYGFVEREGRHRKLRHVGATVIGEDVEVGANCAVDRALLGETRIGAGTKIDNLVQVGHNVETGSDCLLVSQVGISGSSRLGDRVVMAGQSGAAGHLELGDGARVAAKSAVFKSVEAGRTVAGIPAIEASRWRRVQAVTAKLDEMRRRLRALERRLKEGPEGKTKRGG